MEGRTAPEIAGLLKVHRAKVSIWIRKYEEHGINSLKEAHRSGRPGGLSERELEELADIIESGPIAYGFNSGVWTSPMIKK